MTILKGYLTAMLTKEQQEDGYTLEEDADFVYLNHPDRTTSVFTNRTTLEHIQKAIEKQY
jgi:hypothetical protein